MRVGVCRGSGRGKIHVMKRDVCRRDENILERRYYDMKINVFKITNDKVDELLGELERNAEGLKMKHSQTFTSAGKKDITSYMKNRRLNDSHDYGEAFSYVKCKTVDKELWGETADFGESARFSFGRDFSLHPLELYKLTDQIEKILELKENIKLPRYHKVTDNDILLELNSELEKKFIEYITDVDAGDYWLAGVSFNFSNDYRYSLKIYRTDFAEISDVLDANLIREVILNNKDKIKGKKCIFRI